MANKYTSLDAIAIKASRNEPFQTKLCRSVDWNGSPTHVYGTPYVSASFGECPECHQALCYIVKSYKTSIYWHCQNQQCRFQKAIAYHYSKTTRQQQQLLARELPLMREALTCAYAFEEEQRKERKRNQRKGITDYYSHKLEFPSSQEEDATSAWIKFQPEYSIHPSSMQVEQEVPHGNTAARP